MKAIVRPAGLLVALILAPCAAWAGLIFNFNSTGNAAADNAFQAAADRWSSIFSDDIILNISIGYSPLGSGILGSSFSSEQSFTYSQTRAALAADATSAYDGIAVANLPAGPAVKMLINRTSNDPAGAGSATPYLDADGDANNTTVTMSTSNAKALGLVAGNAPGIDGSITFSSNFSFDLDPSDGISAGDYDFVGIATHELGHLLGFVSGVDVLDENSPPYDGPFRDDQFTDVRPLQPGCGGN